MGKRNMRWASNVYEILVIGEQLRKQMHDQGQVRDRRHHLRKHKQCFSGRDTIDWLLKANHVKSREEAVSCMQILKQYGLFHHVTDEQEFKDQNTFYRFTFDDQTYKLNLDLSSFYWGHDIYRKLKANNGDIMQEFYLKGSLYSEAFFGCDLVDFIVVSEGEENRDVVIAGLRDLLERDIIKHVTDDYHFSDDKLIYEFNLDFDKPCKLQDVLELMAQRKTSDVTVSSRSLETEATCSQNDMVNQGAQKVMTSDLRDSVLTGVSNHRGSRLREDDSSVILMTHDFEPESVLVRTATVENLDDPMSPYTKSCLRITSDSMGFGFVLRGSSPCYVYAVDPLGPAVAAGLKSGQFIANVSGQSVLDMDHGQVGQLMIKTNTLSLTVLTYRLDDERQ